MLMLWFLNRAYNTVTFLSKQLLYMITYLRRTLCIVTLKVPSCKFLKYNLVNSFCGFCYRFVRIFHEKFIIMKINIHHYNNQTKTTTKITFWEKHLEKGSNKQKSWVITNLFLCMNFGITLLSLWVFRFLAKDIVCPNCK